MKGALRLMAGLMACALGGCVLPVPVTRTEVPSIHGQVVHAQSGIPVDMAGVMIEGHKETAVLTARDGSFHTDSVSRSSPFRVWNPFDDGEVETLKLRLARPGFEKQTERIEWRKGKQSEVHLANPIRLRP